MQAARRTARQTERLEEMMDEAKIFFPQSIEEIKEDRGKNKEDKENLDRLTKNWGK